MNKDFYIKASGNKSIVLGDDGDGLCLSIHVPGGNLLITLDHEEGLQLLKAVQAIMGDENES